MDPNLEKQKITLEIEEKELEAREFVESYGPFRRYLLIVVAILIIPGFFAAKYITAALYVSNYSKTAPAAHPASFVTLPASIVETKILAVAGNSYSAYALVKNQNKDLADPNLKYVFNFSDSSGKLLASVSGTDFLLPGQLKYLIVPNVTLAEAPAKVEVSLPDQTWQKRLDIPNIQIDTPLPTHADSQDPPGFAIDGTFRNQSNFTLRTVVIKGIVHDRNNQVIAVTSRVENTVSPKQLRGYHLYWPQFLESSVSRLEINVETDPFDQANLQ